MEGNEDNQSISFLENTNNKFTISFFVDYDNINTFSPILEPINFEELMNKEQKNPFRRINYNDNKFSFNTPNVDDHNFVFVKDTKTSSKNIEDSASIKQPNIIIKNDEKRRIKFCIAKLKKRGRNPNSQSKNKLREHKGNAFDNILSRVKADFFTFLINLANDAKNSCINLEEKEENFHDISRKIKENKKKEKITELIEKENDKEYKYKYKDIFKLETTKKSIGFIKSKSEKDEERANYNNKIYNKICEEYPILYEFFEQGFMEVIEKYYFLNKNYTKNEFVYKDLKIKLSDKTKTFWDLLNKIKNKADHAKYKEVLFKYFKLSVV